MRVCMDIQHRPALLRAARAWLDADQRGTAAAAGIGLNTLLSAERGAGCTDKTWNRMVEHYRSQGLTFAEADDLTLIIAR